MDAQLLLIQIAFLTGNEWRPLLGRAQRLAEATGDLALQCRLANEEYVILRATSAPAAVRAASRLLELALHIGDRRFECRAHLSLAELAIQSFDVASAREHVAAGAAVAGEIGQADDRLRALYAEGLLELNVGRFPVARGLLNQALQLADSSANIGTILATLNSIAYAHLNEGHPTEAMAVLNDAWSTAQQFNFPLAQCDILSNLAECHAQLGDENAAFEAFECCLILCRELQKSQMQPAQMAEIMLLYLCAGKLERATEILPELLPLMELARSGWHPQQAFWAVSCVYHEVGRPELARRYLDEADAIVSERLARIPDEESRQSYRRIAFNAAILDASKTGSWPELRGHFSLLR